MGVFVDWATYSFLNLSNTPDDQIILTTSTENIPHVIQVENIMVTNKIGTQPIRITLIKTRTFSSGTPTPIITTIQPQFQIASDTRTDILQGTGIRLDYDNSDPTNIITDSLTIYSAGYTQIFDCYVSFYILNELPLVD